MKRARFIRLDMSPPSKPESIPFFGFGFKTTAYLLNSNDGIRGCRRLMAILRKERLVGQGCCKGIDQTV